MSLFRLLRRYNLVRVKPPNPKYIPKPYEQMLYPGQRVQIDVKYVPASCMSGKVSDKKYYRYTAIDEFTRFRYVQAFDEKSTYNSVIFLRQMLKYFKLNKFKVECVQTDNGTEFTKRFTSHKDTLSAFEKELNYPGIRHKLIRPYTPRHNGKVERSHRKDNEYFYATHKLYSLKDFTMQLAVHNRNTTTYLCGLWDGSGLEKL